MAGFAEVSDVLWRERELLDVLLFKLDQQRLLLTEGGTHAIRWLTRASREIGLVLEELRLVDLTRALEVDALAVELELPSAPALGALVESAPAPWDDLFAAHRVALESLIEQVRTAAQDNRHRLAVAASEAGRECAGDQ